jgi:hypothetical protein
MTPESETHQPSTKSQKIQLPGVGTLFSQGWKYVQNNLWLAGVLSVPFLVVDIFTYLNEISTKNESLQISVGSVLGLVSFAALIMYVLLMATALYLVTHQSQSPLFTDGFAWAKRHFWSLVWINLLTGLIVWGGFLLLIIPGIIASIYMALSQMVLVTEGKKGLSALMRSRELVCGNWWAVLGRILGVQLLYFCVILAAGVVVGVGTAFLSSNSVSEFVTAILFTVLSSVGAIIFLNVIYALYTSLKNAKETTPSDIVQPATIRYQVLAWLGLFVPVVIGGLVMLAIQTGKFSIANMSRLADTTLLTELNNVQSQADAYYSSQPEQTFNGVCSEIQSLISGDGEVVCNESKDAYVLSVQQGDVLRCVDSTGYNKIIYTDLGEQTRCLDI